MVSRHIPFQRETALFLHVQVCMFVGLTDSEVDRLIAASYDPDPEIRRCVHLRLGVAPTGVLSGLATAVEREEIVRRVRALLDEVEQVRMRVACD